MFLNDTVNFRCDMLWSPDIILAWYLWLILILFLLFQINVQFLSSPKCICLISKNKGYKKGRMRPFLAIFFSIKNMKSLIDPLKGAAPLTGVIGYA